MEPRPAPSEQDIASIRRSALALASGRKERPSSLHLLAAIAGGEGAAGDLLRERGVTPPPLLASPRHDEEAAVLRRAIDHAHALASRTPAGASPGAMHLLLALLGDRGCAARHALERLGVDPARLRTRAFQLAAGIVAPRRHAPPPAPPPGATSIERRDARSSAGGRVKDDEPGRGARPTSRPRRGTGGAVAVPLFPPPGHPSARPPAEPVPLLPPPGPAGAENKRAAPPLERGATRQAAQGGERRRAPRAAPLPRFALDAKLFPTLAALGHNLTLAAAAGELEPVIGRAQEIERVLDVLARRRANNPCLVGPAGVGKTSIVRAVAQRIASGGGATPLDERILVELPVAELLAGTAVRGALAERLAALRAELRAASGRVVLVVDEVHELFTALGEEAISELRAALERGELPLLGATTPEEFRRVVEADPALARRFSVVPVDEPSEEEAFAVLRAAEAGLSAHHHVRFTEEAIAASVGWSARYVSGRALPDKAISLLDLAGARARRRGKGCVAPPEVAEVVAEVAGVPLERLLESDRERMLALESVLGERVVGHEASLSRIAAILRKNAAGFRSRRPIGSFLLLGPTGVGKTETARAVAEALFGSPEAMTRLDLSEFSEPHAVARLVGAPPGYVGFESGGQLTEAIRRRPYQVVLLDEIEKAHRDVLEVFLQVLDDGRLTDGRGRRVDFTNTVIVLTSNLGAQDGEGGAGERPLGFGSRTRSAASRRAAAADLVLRAARAALPPELFNRFDEVLVYPELTREEVAEVARRLLRELTFALDERGVTLEIEEDAVEVLLDAGGFDPALGARPMKRTIARLLEAPLAELLLRGELGAGATVLVRARGDALALDVVAPVAATA